MEIHISRTTRYRGSLVASLALGTRGELPSRPRGKPALQAALGAARLGTAIFQRAGQVPSETGRRRRGSSSSEGALDHWIHGSSGSRIAASVDRSPVPRSPRTRVERERVGAKSRRRSFSLFPQLISVGRNFSSLGSAGGEAKQ